MIGDDTDACRRIGYPIGSLMSPLGRTVYRKFGLARARRLQFLDGRAEVHTLESRTVADKLIAVILNSVDELVDSGMALLSEMEPESQSARMSRPEQRNWMVYEMRCLAEAMIGDDEQIRPLCHGVAFLARPGRECLAPATAAVMQLHYGRSLALTVSRAFADDPALMEEALVLLQRGIESIVRVNAMAFLDQALSEARHLQPREGIGWVERASLESSSSMIPKGPASLLGRDSRRGRDSLSSREIDVLRRIALGESNGEIAGALGIAENTVKNHVRHLLAKLELRTRYQLGLYAIQSGLGDITAALHTQPTDQTRPSSSCGAPR